MKFPTVTSRVIPCLALAAIAVSSCSATETDLPGDTMVLERGRDSSTGAPAITVYKTAACGCCRGWVAHLRANSFRVIAIDTSSAEIGRLKRAHGVPGSAASCHTAFVNGYVIEGHVPATDVQRLLKDSPGIVGIAVPGMPAGSPGMEGPVVDRYDVLALHPDGRHTVFARH